MLLVEPVQAQAQAQDAAAAETAKKTESDTAGNEIVVTGYTASVIKSLEEKRRSNTMIDVISAEDVGKFPESNLAEALQRLPGINIERENGEGRTITVRGLGGDFVRTRLNGIETVAAAGNNEGQTNINRTRGFDFNVFASDLFSRLTVRKSAEATVDEGSLGSTVDIDTGTAFKKKGFHVSVSAQDTFYQNDKQHNPRFAGVVSNTFFNDTLGITLSGAYQKRKSSLSFYDRNPGQFEVIYRGSDLAGPVQNGTGNANTPVCITSGAPTVNATTNRSPLNCFWGFAIPTPSTTSAAASGIGRTAFGIDANSLMFGSDPTAYSVVSNNLAANMPALTTLQKQELEQERLGLTGTVEWRPTDHTRLRIDGLYAKFDADSDSHILGAFGLNRHFDNARAEIGLTNTSTGLRPFSGTGASYFGDRRGVYGNSCTTSATLDCTGTLGNASVAVLPTAQYWNGSTYVSVPSVLNVNTWSTNPYNLDTYDYYNNPNSPGYNAAAAATDPRGILNYDQMVGKEHTAIVDAHANGAGQIDYLKLNRVDWLTNDAYAQNRSKYYQFDIRLEQDFSERLSGTFTWGRSSSELRIDGGRTDVFALDKNNFVFDERQGGVMPTFQPGFDVTNVNEFGGGDLVKGYAGIARYTRESDNKYQTFRGDFNWNIIPDKFWLLFGASQRNYDYRASQKQVSRGVISTIKELNKYGRDTNNPLYANLTLAQMGSQVTFGEGLDLPAGTPTSWWSPDRKVFEKIFGYTCDCVNQFADWRLANENGNILYVKERDLSGYVQGDFNFDLFGRPLRGNLGVRVARTRVNSRSVGTTGAFNGVEIAGANEYTDVLPSANFNYEFTDKLVARLALAKTMARPQLGNLGPGVTSISIGTTPDSSNLPRVTLGNPTLKPFRSNNIDFVVEWYPNSKTMLSLALFYKKLGDYPRQQTFNAKLDEFLPPETYAAIRNGLTLTAQQSAYMDGDNIWAITSFVDSPGGYVKGVEVQFQQVLSFLPKPFDGFGVQANFTYLKSELSYLTQQGTQAKAPWPFASPHSLNATLFYEKGPFEARVSYSWRDRYASVFPQSIGVCPPGLLTDPATGGVCTNPYNDFSGTEGSQYVDFKMSYKITKNFKADFAVQNVFNEPESQWLYDPSVVRKYSSGAGRIFTFGLRADF
ncbi:TonB-dependent receptor [Novosphingobium sp. MW5]|nr:TonB-dependent receptor [Novosphingobium sp. MW5]